ncbi:hypothetical protein JOM56_014039 [Amanita muscaria]
MAIFKPNKDGTRTSQKCLYIAYYARVPKPTSPGRYHAALVVLPESGSSQTYTRKSTFGRLLSAILPVSSSSTQSKEESIKFHVINVPVSDSSGKGRVAWDFRVEKDDTAANGTKLRMRLVALMLVGSVTIEGVEETLTKVDIPKYTDLRPEWKCTNFLYEALTLLESSGIIPALPSIPLSQFWDMGVQFADKWRTEESVQMLASGAAVPCCDREGKEIAGPLGPAV